jgi:tRNA 2-(methylsulfanyl)-N6-isopentenyladenosine37 hydroxylase
MLNLKSATSPIWVENAVAHLDAIVLDHIHCEKKAAATALSLISRYTDHEFLVLKLVRYAQEELDHFRLLHAHAAWRGWKLTFDSADGYVNQLLKHVRKQEPHRLLDSLICAALIEARSCERFDLLVKALPECEERKIYAELIPMEAAHYTLFLDIARTYFTKDELNTRLEEISIAEKAICDDLPNHWRMHG